MSQELLTHLFNVAVEAADPYEALKRIFPAKPKGRTVVVGAGKGAAQMAAAFERLWDENGYGPLSGVVVTRYGYKAPCRTIEVLESAHPVPDENGFHAAQRLMQTVEGLSEDDLVVALICGGGSALLPLPADGLTLADEVALNEALLKSGAPIGAMNAIRKHISQIKGGRLAKQAYPAKVISFIVSDIPGDNPALVSSGPTVPDRADRQDALRFIHHYDIKLAPHVMAHIKSDASVAPLPDDMVFARNEVHVIASSAISLKAAQAQAQVAGYRAVILSDAIEGEAREIAHMHAAMAKYIQDNNEPFAKPVILLSGGETTVTIKNPKGKGGRNSEFLLSFALDIIGTGGIEAMAADTDGIDGSQDNAGAFCNGETIADMKAAGVDGAKALQENNAWVAFNAVDSLFAPGPTGTNVNDFRAIIIR